MTGPAEPVALADTAAGAGAASADRRRRVSISAVVGGALVSLVILVALVSFVWTPADPTAIDPPNALAGPGTPGHPLGADNFGRDILSQLMAGARITLVVGIVAVAIAAAVGVPLGVVAGMRRGWLGELLLRFNDILFGFPALLLAFLLAAAFGASTVTAMVAIGVATIPAFLRQSYAGTRQVMATDYVLAARASGVHGVRMAVRHVLPNISAVLLVQASVAFAIAILAEAGLSYLGLSAGPQTPSWGRMLRDAQTFLFGAPRLSVWPGLAIATAVLGFNLLGDGLRDLLDPKMRDR